MFGLLKFVAFLYEVIAFPKGNAHRKSLAMLKDKQQMLANVSFIE
jgi:hypothetical protein